MFLLSLFMAFSDYTNPVMFRWQIVEFVGAGVAWMRSRDACIALVRVRGALSSSCQGDASVPTPPNSAPAPTGTKSLQKRHDKNLPVKVLPLLRCKEQTNKHPTSTKVTIPLGALGEVCHLLWSLFSVTMLVMRRCSQKGRLLR